MNRLTGPMIGRKFWSHQQQFLSFIDSLRPLSILVIHIDMKVYDLVINSQDCPVQSFLSCLSLSLYSSMESLPFSAFMLILEQKQGSMTN